MAVILRTHDHATLSSLHRADGVTGAMILISVMALIGILALGIAALGGGHAAVTPSVDAPATPK